MIVFCFRFQTNVHARQERCDSENEREKSPSDINEQTAKTKENYVHFTFYWITLNYVFNDNVRAAQRHRADRTIVIIELWKVEIALDCKCVVENV